MKYALLLTHDLECGPEDILRLKKLFNCYKITTQINGYPLKEIKRFLDTNKLKEKDTLYIYCSCHGVKRGIKIGDKVHILTCLLNPDKSITTSYEIDRVLSSALCNVILMFDCCHSETLGDFYTGDSLVFIGSSKLSNVSASYSIDGKPYCGSLVCLLEYLFGNNIKTLDINKIKTSYRMFFKKYNIKQELVIKILTKK